MEHFAPLSRQYFPFPTSLDGHVVTFSDRITAQSKRTKVSTPQQTKSSGTRPRVETNTISSLFFISGEWVESFVRNSTEQAVLKEVLRISRKLELETFKLRLLLSEGNELEENWHLLKRFKSAKADIERNVKGHVKDFQSSCSELHTLFQALKTASHSLRIYASSHQTVVTELLMENSLSLAKGKALIMYVETILYRRIQWMLDSSSSVMPKPFHTTVTALVESCQSELFDVDDPREIGDIVKRRLEELKT